MKHSKSIRQYEAEILARQLSIQCRKRGGGSRPSSIARLIQWASAITGEALTIADSKRAVRQLRQFARS